MPNTLISDLKSNIEFEISTIKLIPADSQQSSYFAKYLIVYLSGMYEELIEKIVSEWSKTFSSNEFNQFVESILNQYFHNPDTEKIALLLGRFNPAWPRLISTLPIENIEALDSIVRNKNALAHGRTVIITLRDVYEYHEKAMIVIDKIIEIFGMD